MKYNWTLKNVEVSVGEVSVKVGELSTEVSEFTVAESISALRAVGEIVPALLREVKEIMEEDNDIVFFGDTDGDIHEPSFMEKVLEERIDDADTEIRQLKQAIKELQEDKPVKSLAREQEAMEF